MARIRTIKPEFWRHPVLARLPDDFQLLALALLSMADDDGYFRADSALVRGEVMPFRENLVRISEGLTKLAEVGWIELRQHSEQGLTGHIKTWDKHQKVDHKTASKLARYFTRENLATEQVEPSEKLAPEQGTGNREVDQGRDALDREVREIASLYPKITDPFNLAHDVAVCIAEAIMRHGRDVVWAGTKCYQDAVKNWPVGERQFVLSPQKFFRESVYLTNPGEWERSANGTGKPVSAAEARSDRSKQNILDGFAANARRRDTPDGTERQDRSRERTGSGV